MIKAEEANFFGTIDGGLAKIDRMFSEMTAKNRVIVPGEDAAELYQTYGVPPELVENIAAEKNFTFDWEGFRKAMDEHDITSGGGPDLIFHALFPKPGHYRIWLQFLRNDTLSTIPFTVRVLRVGETLVSP